MSDFEVISLSGKAGSGKDFIFDNILKPLGYARFALADHFKIWAVGRKLATYEECFITKPAHIRDILQKTGTEEGRNVYGDEIWLDTAYVWMEHLSNTMGITKYCITDARFENEVEYIRAREGKVFRIEAPNRVALSRLTVKQRLHPSETSLDKYTDFDGFIYNNPKEAETVKKQVHDLLGEETQDQSIVWDLIERMEESYRKIMRREIE